MRLQFLINHYNETPEIVERMLQSIAMQEGVEPDKNYDVLICSDGADDVLDADFFSRFPFTVHYTSMPHRGVCATRNTLLDMASADYVMFCDADDCFSSPDGAATLLREAEGGTQSKVVDIVAAPFDSEVKKKDGFHLTRIHNNIVWIHSKLFRLEYLRENDIRFPDEVETAGDMSFVWQAFRMTDNIQFLMQTYYTWKWNDNSVTRILPFTGIRTYPNMIKSFALLAEKMIARQREDLYNDIIATVISAAYIDCRFNKWANAPEEYVSAAKLAVGEFIQKFLSYYTAMDEIYRLRRYNSALVSKRTYGPKEGYAGIAAWLEEIFND